MRPTFIGIGAQKCASTWLHHILAEHPAIGVAADKEIDFFSYHFDHGYQWYEKWFTHCNHRFAVGEISPSYFCDAAAPQRVHEYIPNAKILLTLRDPVERALSNHRHEVRVGHFTSDGFSFEAGMVNNPMYFEQGRYATHLKRWLEYFPRRQIRTILMDDIENDPEAVVSSTYAFLEVDPSYEPKKITTRINESFTNRSQSLAGLKDILYKSSRLPWLRWSWNIASLFGLRKMYRSVNKVASDKAIPKPSEEILFELRKRFEPEIRELAELIDRPLDDWLRRGGT